MSFSEPLRSHAVFSISMVRCVVGSLGLAFFSGCGDGYSGPTGTVAGSVMFNGNPVPTGSTVSFVSDEGFVASGRVEDGGSYKLEIAGKGPNIPAATYKVMVSPPATGGVSGTDADYAKYMESVNPNDMGKVAKPAEAFPSKYVSTGTSDLEFPVNAGENTINVELK